MVQVNRARDGDARDVPQGEQTSAEHVLRTLSKRYSDELPGVDAEAIEILLSVLRTVRVHRTAVTRTLESMDLDVAVTGARYTLLMTLLFSRDNLLAQNEISRELNVSRTNITNLIDGLERDGLVERVPNPSDRRVSYARLTERGRDVCMELMPSMTALMQDATRDFSEDERAQLKGYLYRMQRNIVSTHPGTYARGLAIEEPQPLE
jgi:DNA-binding MarR family transcriptional regulator